MHAHTCHACMHDVNNFHFNLLSAENKNGVALLLLPMLLDKKYKNGGESLLQFLEVSFL